MEPGTLGDLFGRTIRIAGASDMLKRKMPEVPSMAFDTQSTCICALNRSCLGRTGSVARELPVNCRGPRLRPDRPASLRPPQSGLSIHRAWRGRLPCQRAAHLWASHGRARTSARSSQTPRTRGISRTLLPSWSTPATGVSSWCCTSTWSFSAALIRPTSAGSGIPLVCGLMMGEYPTEP